jgi:hypothetical protein
VILQRSSEAARSLLEYDALWAEGKAQVVGWVGHYGLDAAAYRMG